MISVYYPYEFEAHKNLSHKQFLIQVYYFMDYAVKCFTLMWPTQDQISTLMCVKLNQMWHFYVHQRKINVSVKCVAALYHIAYMI